MRAGAAQLMYWTMDATSRWAAVFYIVVIFFGAIFLVDLAIGVVAEAYEDVVSEEELKEQGKSQSALPKQARGPQDPLPKEAPGSPALLTKQSLSRSASRKSTTRLGELEARAHLPPLQCSAVLVV